MFTRYMYYCIWVSTPDIEIHPQSLPIFVVPSPPSIIEVPHIPPPPPPSAKFSY